MAINISGNPHKDMNFQNPSLEMISKALLGQEKERSVKTNILFGRKPFLKLDG